MTTQNTSDSALESLRAIAHWLTSEGYTIGIKRVSPGSLQPAPGVVNTITGWQLTWSRKTTNGWAECGHLMVADGEAPLRLTTQSISALRGFLADDCTPREWFNRENQQASR